MKYLHIKFGDNDFGGCVESALKRLWGWVHENNAHCISTEKNDRYFSNLSLAEMFVRLNRAGSLKPLISRMIDLEYMASNVEFETRGLYWKRVEWKEKGNLSPMESLTSRYLSFDISFHKNKTFTKKWQNGEHAFLNLKTGEAKTF